jgi:purine-binding chemotaxis protein CheW
MSNQPDNTAEILRARARALARTSDRPAETGEVLDIVEFHLARERYAVESRYVQEVCPLKDLTPLPCTPDFVRGIVNVRGRILPVFDLKRFFHLPELGVTDLHRIVLIRGHGLELGLLADGVTSVRTIRVDSLQPPLPTLTGIGREYLKGVTGERLIVLDLDRILTDSKIIVHDEVV